VSGPSKKWQYNPDEAMEAFLETTQQDEQTQPQAPAEEDVNWGRFALDILETLILAVVLFVGINAVSARVRVDGFSMLPTLKDGEFVLVNKLSYRFGEVERGDIIVFHYPMNPEEELIKRVIGLPGDQVVVQNQQVSVNGIVLAEGYIAAAPLYAGEWVVADGHLFVLGDNRNDSSDSHSWGLLPLDKVVGKAVLIYWPPPMWEFIEHTEILAAQ
jgi:signal peptidase I